MRILLTLALSLASLGPQQSMADAPAESTPVVRPCDQWVGAWRVSPEFGRLLGFDDRQDREEAVFDHPASFTLAIDAELGASIAAPKRQEMEIVVFKKIGHKVVATGRWETTFEVDPGIDSECYVTEKDGATFLWVGAPYAVLYGGKVSLLQGADASRDHLVIDFNSLPKPKGYDQRSLDTVAFQRAQKPTAR
jgi:hypothetical protein